MRLRIVVSTAASASIGGHAEDENSLRREKALSQDRHRPAAGSARVHVAQPGQEAGQAPAAAGPPGGRGEERSARGEAPARRRGAEAMTRVKRSVHARKKRRAVLARAK